MAREWGHISEAVNISHWMNDVYDQNTYSHFTHNQSVNLVWAPTKVNGGHEPIPNTRDEVYVRDWVFFFACL
jgi:hypothetical protein